MKLFVLVLAVATCCADRLDRGYLPPAGAPSAGGSPGAIEVPQGPGQYQGQGSSDISNPNIVGGRLEQLSNGNNYPTNSYDTPYRSSAANEGREVGRTAPERAQAASERSAGIIRQHSDLTDEGFSYAFETENGISAEESGTAKNGVVAKGSFSYTGDDGNVYSITYTADENGYRPEGAHLPTPPPVPQEILRALEQNARDEANGIFDDGSYDARKYGDSGEDTNQQHNHRGINTPPGQTYNAANGPLTSSQERPQSPDTSVLEFEPQNNNIVRNNAKLPLHKPPVQYNGATSPQYNAPSSPQYSAATSPQYNAATRPQYNAATSPQYNAASSPQFNSASSPQYNAATSPQYNAASSPKYNAASSPQYNAATIPQYNAATSPQYNAASSPKYNAASSPQYNAAASLQYNAASSPKYNSASSPQYNAVTSPQYNAPVQIKSATNNQYPALNQNNDAQRQQSNAPVQNNAAPIPQYITPVQNNASFKNQYNSPSQNNNAQRQQYNIPAENNYAISPQYNAPVPNSAAYGNQYKAGSTKAPTNDAQRQQYTSSVPNNFAAGPPYSAQVPNNSAPRLQYNAPVQNDAQRQHKVTVQNNAPVKTNDAFRNQYNSPSQTHYPTRPQHTGSVQNHETQNPKQQYNARVQNNVAPSPQYNAPAVQNSVAPGTSTASQEFGGQQRLTSFNPKTGYQY